jgi:serine/tyrosine/threonine adenylyltransferase
MRRVNPALIPRNHRIEQAIGAAIDREDFGPFMELSAALCEPYRTREKFASLADPPRAEERVLRTFCGT